MCCLRRGLVPPAYCVSRRRPLELEGMSIRTALAQLDKAQLRDLLLQLMPDPLSGRPGPVQILSPFETEQQLREEMARMQKSLDSTLAENERLGELIQKLQVELLTVKPMLDEQKEARIATLEAELQKLKS